MSRRERGFTLLETVVTLVIVSLLVTMLMQALNHALGLRTRLLRVQQDSRAAMLQEAWFRESVAAAQDDLDDAMGAMEGDARSLAFASMMPLASPGMARVQWWLDGDADGVALHYTDAGSGDITIVPGPLQDGAFAYMDHAGAWHDEWEPGPEAEERLPRLVRFEAETAKGRLYWLVPLLADPIARERLRPDRMLGNGAGNGLDQVGGNGN